MNTQLDFQMLKKILENNVQIDKNECHEGNISHTNKQKTWMDNSR